MKPHTIDLINKQGLRFFGSVNASISHELKNIFAIISETAGFLNDLTQLSKQGKPFDLSLLENCSNSIAEEIERGFDTIRQMNQFAHSVDDPVRETSIADTLTLAVKLTGYLSFAKKVHLDETAEDTTVFTSPFLFQTLIYKIFSALYRTLDVKDELTLTFHDTATSAVTIQFSHNQSADLDHFPDPQTAEIADVLKATVKITDTGLELTVPLKNEDLESAATDSNNLSAT
jgi:signal transduction histidine kinase